MQFFLLIRSIDSVAVAIAVAVFIILVNESFAISPILLAEILAYNKSALCRSASLAIQFCYTLIYNSLSIRPSSGVQQTVHVTHQNSGFGSDWITHSTLCSPTWRYKKLRLCMHYTLLFKRFVLSLERLVFFYQKEEDRDRRIVTSSGL